MKHVAITLQSQSDPFLGEQYCHELTYLSPEATLEDLCQALDDFAAQHLAPCKGCDGCCHERAPLILADIPRLAHLLPATPFPAHAVCNAFATIQIHSDGASDIFLKRNADSACLFLHPQEKYCRQHDVRPFVCRSHFCLPRGQQFSLLRQEIVNQGEDALTSLLLAEEALGAPPFEGGALQQRLNASDYPAITLEDLVDHDSCRIWPLLSPHCQKALAKLG